MISFQVLFKIISFCCLSLFILLISLRYFIPNSTRQISFEFQQIPIEEKNYLPDKSIASIRTANSSTESYICDAVKSNHTHNRTSSFSFEDHRFTALRRSYSPFNGFPLIELFILRSSLLWYCSYTSKSMDISETLCRKWHRLHHLHRCCILSYPCNCNSRYMAISCYT